jgi:hypothetical protein
MTEAGMIRTPDQRVRVFVSSTLTELAAERRAVRDAVTRLRLVPVMFELGARPHPPRTVYRAYLAQSQVFVAVYWQSYGWVAPGERTSGLEDEYQLSAGMPRLIYVKSAAPDREPRLAQLLARIQDEGGVSCRQFSEPAELQQLVENDLAVLLSERFEMTRPGQAAAGGAPLAGALPVPATPLLGRASASCSGSDASTSRAASRSTTWPAASHAVISAALVSAAIRSESSRLRCPAQASWRSRLRATPSSHGSGGSGTPGSCRQAMRNTSLATSSAESRSACCKA